MRIGHIETNRFLDAEDAMGNDVVVDVVVDVGSGGL